MSYDYPEYFDKIEGNEAFLNKMIRCNVDSVANLTQMLLPGLSRSQLATHQRLMSASDLEMIKKQRGIIVNVSSISGRRPAPLLGLYSGTKGFVDLFSRFAQRTVQCTIQVML